MLARITMVLMFSALTACGGEGQQDDVVAVYKSRGTVQCGPAGAPLSDFQRQLTDAGVRVVSASCGNTGVVGPALCGAWDGAIVIFEVPAEQASVAASLSFAPLAGVPGAQAVPCN